MKFSFRDLTEFVEKAGSLYERLEENYSFINTEQLSKEADAKLITWKKNAAGEDEDKFHKRLAWDGLSSEDLKSILQTNRLNFPDWLYTLEEVLNLTDKRKDKNQNRYIIEEDPVPFQELLIPFVNAAANKLLKQAENTNSLLTEAAEQNIERALLKDLSKTAAVIVLYEFKLVNNKRKVSYKSFITRMRRGEFLSFLKKYPVLARLLSSICINWTEANSEFLQRLTRDKPELENIFNNSKGIGELTGIKTGISDRHKGGRTVMALTFSSGLKLIYKPRPVGMENIYNNLLRWINKKGFELQNKVVEVLDKEDYGWMEYVDHKPCQNKQEISRFYQRAGMLLCILHVLSGTDFHYDNLIASGEFPVLVDLEMLFNAYIPEKDSVRRVETDEEAFSVLRTGLLPLKQREKITSDISGLSGGIGMKTTFREPKWVNINKDNMFFDRIYQNVPPRKNIVYLEEEAVSPDKYIEEIILGFRNMYNFWLKNRVVMLAPDGILPMFMNKTARFIFRPTELYYFCGNITLHPSFLKSGIDRSIELDRICKKYLTANEKPPIWPIIKEEHLAIERLDVPYFTFNINGTSIQLNDKKSINNIFKPSAYELVCSKISNLNDEDLEKQIRVINRAFSPLDDDGRYTWKSAECRPLSREVLISKAVDIGETVLEISEYCGSSAELSSSNLYCGRLGLALFLAALARVKPEKRFLDKALSEVKVFKEEFMLIGVREYADKFGIGVAGGLGSLVYTLFRIAQFLDNQNLLLEAETLGKLIDQGLIFQDENYDIISGSAGAILALLALYNATENIQFLNQAHICGNYLCEKRVKSNTGFRGWKNSLSAAPEGKLLTGFSHGQAGIAYALFKLYAASRNEIYKQAAVEAINYEQSVFSKKARNWPDYRLAFMVDQETPNFMNSWCNGAAGIGLSRLGILEIWDNESVREDITAALAKTRGEQIHKVDHLCCGHFGQMALLLTAYQKLGDRELYEEAMQMASCILERERKMGHFTLSDKGKIPELGFFRGLSGIGYQLLRLALPEEFPSILLFE